MFVPLHDMIRGVGVGDGQHRPFAFGMVLVGCHIESFDVPKCRISICRIEHVLPSIPWKPRTMYIFSADSERFFRRAVIPNIDIVSCFFFSFIATDRIDPDC